RALEAQVLGQLAQALVGDVLDGGRPLAQGLHVRLVDVDPDHRGAGLGERHGEGQPDVAESDYPDRHGGASLRGRIPATAAATRSPARPSPYSGGRSGGGDRSSAASAASASRSTRTF